MHRRPPALRVGVVSAGLSGTSQSSAMLEDCFLERFVGYAYMSGEYQAALQSDCRTAVRRREVTVDRDACVLELSNLSQCAAGQTSSHDQAMLTCDGVVAVYSVADRASFGCLPGVVTRLLEERVPLLLCGLVPDSDAGLEGAVGTVGTEGAEDRHSRSVH